MKKSRLLASVCVIIFGFTTISSHASLVAEAIGSNFYQIDEQTGAATLLTTSNSPRSFGAGTGLAFLDNTLYATDAFRRVSGIGTSSTVTVDLSTGSQTFVSNQDGNSNWMGLAGNQADDVLYSINIDAGNILKTLSASGTITSVGATGIQGRGMAYDDANEILYAMGVGFTNPALYTVDTSTGTATLVGSTGFTGNVTAQGLAYDEDNKILYWLADANLSSAGGTNLYSLNTQTGLASLVGDTGLSFGAGLAWMPTPVPLPGAVWLFGSGLLCLVGMARRKKAA